MLAQKSASIKRLEKETISSPKGMISRLYSPEIKPKGKGFL
jgi:hypothetical protein